MKILLSPAKALNEEMRLSARSKPVFLDKSKELIRGLRKLSEEEVATLMKLSPELARLNCKRFANWKAVSPSRKSLAAAALFDGPAFRGLDFPSLDQESQTFAQERLRILSGLYGILRPLDAIVPYRLEMGARFPADIKERVLKEKNLYEFWGESISNFLRGELHGPTDKEAKPGKSEKQATSSKLPLLVNLASNEYSKAARLSNLQARIISPVFLDKTKSGEYKTLMAFAKRARGLMARFLIESRAESAKDVLAFDREGYAYDPKRSKTDAPVFCRKAPP